MESPGACHVVNLIILPAIKNTSVEAKMIQRRTRFRRPKMNCQAPATTGARPNAKMKVNALNMKKIWNSEPSYFVVAFGSLLFAIVFVISAARYAIPPISKAPSPIIIPDTVRSIPFQSNFPPQSEQCVVPIGLSC